MSSFYGLSCFACLCSNRVRSRPSAHVLAAKVGALKCAETKVADGQPIDPGRGAAHKTEFADGGGDKTEVCKALDLDETERIDGGEAAFHSKYLDAKGVVPASWVADSTNFHVNMMIWPSWNDKGKVCKAFNVDAAMQIGPRSFFSLDLAQFCLQN